MGTPKQLILSKLGVKPRRNSSLFDGWSVVHIITGLFFGWVMDPFVALSIMILWEPLEVFVLSPFLAKFDIDFGYESLRNSLSDIVFDTAGVAAGYYLLTQLVAPPFHLF